MTDPRALNQDFRKYDQVAKTHTYRLAEDSSDEFDEDYRIAMLDFGKFLHGSRRAWQGPARRIVRDVTADAPIGAIPLARVVRADHLALE